ncbi:hybrid sensor histidine kinase/response regulator [Azospirillum canadense]|uniref:hybrid sensor histidine kinase/response regulator n=1 Tax=Azospirillum canadense TaxID=403962 RepID=UPI002225EDD7|nr:MHYT domain-containing protein [Azospirillum canadense]MCW2243678.1 PAS domain S-box-containing protein [Azospirillum canadense]
MPGHYDLFLVALSVVVAAFGGYVALDLASHAREARRGRNAWLAAAAVALGAGVWSMHFIGMLAFRAPAPVAYDLTLTALSFLLAVGVSGTGLFAVARAPQRRFALAMAGTLTGLGIVSMHYVGMAGMRMPARMTYDPALVALSVLLALAASTAALWLAFRTASLGQRLAGALVLGFAVVSMHYTGMAAASFAEPHAAEPHVTMPHESLAATGGTVLSDPLLAVGTGAATLLILSLALASALLDRRREAERAAEQEARCRSIVDTAVDPIVVIDEAGTILSFNRAAVTTFGYTAEEAVGANVRLLMPDEHRDAHDGYLARYRETGQKRVIGVGREVEGRRKDGSIFPLELSIAEWQAGRKRFFTGIMRDITARKAAEDALRRAKEDAERADLAKTKFLAAASHDLRQPLQSLFFFAHALSDRLHGHPASPLLASMSESLTGLRLLLDSLLDVSRLDAGVVNPAVTQFALGALLERLANEYRPRAAEAGIDLRYLPTSGWTVSDPALLERILRNVIENAVRYTERGRIVIGCRRVGAALRIEVVDSGIGIPADQQKAIFEEFTQLANPERDRRKGLGLGLAIVRRLAGLLDHPLSLRSEPGRGSAFCIAVPSVASRPVPKTCRPNGKPANSKGLVVLVDDDAIILLSMRTMLEGWGYEVVAAMSADEAIGTLTSLGQTPSMIVADYRLREGRTGLQAIRDIFGVCGIRVPAVVLTGDTDPARIAEVQQSGYRVLHKPVSAAVLRDALSSAA